MRDYVNIFIFIHIVLRTLLAASDSLIYRSECKKKIIIHYSCTCK